MWGHEGGGALPGWGTGGTVGAAAQENLYRVTEKYEQNMKKLKEK